MEVGIFTCKQTHSPVTISVFRRKRLRAAKGAPTVAGFMLELASELEQSLEFGSI